LPTLERRPIRQSSSSAAAAAEDDLRQALDQYERNGLGGILAVGKPSQPLLSVPVAMDRIGLAVVAGLTPVAALAESGISVQNKAMSALVELDDLVPVYDL
jgi:repressor of nif and glnA expression